MIQCGSVDLHGRPAMLDGTGLLPPTVSFHVHWQEMHSPVQQLHLDPASTGRPSEIFLSMKQLDSVQCNKIQKKEHHKNHKNHTTKPTKEYHETKSNGVQSKKNDFEHSSLQENKGIIQKHRVPTLYGMSSY